MRLAGLLSLMVLALGLAFGQAQAAEQTFAKPKQGALRVDWCLHWSVDCGQPAADRFCQSKGYVNSTDFTQAPGIGLAAPTIVQGTGQVCNQAFCAGFDYITCQKPDLPPPPLPLPLPSPPPGPGAGGGGGDTQDYYKPRIGGIRLNMCFTKGQGCDGQQAADAFCDKQGYDDAADFQQTSVPPGKSSRYIGNGKICHGYGCTAFQSITCENQP